MLLSTLGTGGEPEFFVKPATVSELQSIIKSEVLSGKNLPVHVIGGGSNVVIPDGKIEGVTISTLGLNSIEWEGSRARIGAGYPLSKLVSHGLEFCVGIPGTIGGAVMGNAGAGGHGVCEFVDEVETVNNKGELSVIRRGEFDFGYRYCSISGAIIVEVTMTLPEPDPKAREEFIERRRSQPAGASAGCTFKNPEGFSAGKLLDECGCKGLRVGGAMVSTDHANFILNTGNATSSDVLELAQLCVKKVFDRTGIKLEREIKTLTPCFFV